MTKVEGSPVAWDENDVEIVASVLIGGIKKEDMSEASRARLDGHLERLKEDSRFKEEVTAVFNRKAINSGRKIPLFSQEVLDALPKSKKRNRKKKYLTGQISLFGQVSQVEDNGNSSLAETVFDSRVNRVDMHSAPNNAKITKAEVEGKRAELRVRIGLPVARGNSPHVNSDFYKWLVKRVYRWDRLGIFAAYCQPNGDKEELEIRIQEVTALVDDLLNGGHNIPERRRIFWRFLDERKENWKLEQW